VGGWGEGGGGGGGGVGGVQTQKHSIRERYRYFLEPHKPVKFSIFVIKEGVWS